MKRAHISRSLQHRQAVMWRKHSRSALRRAWVAVKVLRVREQWRQLDLSVGLHSLTGHSSSDVSKKASHMVFIVLRTMTIMRASLHSRYEKPLIECADALHDISKKPTLVHVLRNRVARGYLVLSDIGPLLDMTAMAQAAMELRGSLAALRMRMGFGS